MRSWRDGPGPASLGESEVHVWKTGRGQVHALLRVLISRYTGLPAGEIRFLRGEYGKPGLDSRRAAAAIEFNLSHSDRLALIALAKARRVGVDIEKQSGDLRTDLLAREFLHLPPGSSARDFWSAWTRREAAVKAQGGSILAAQPQPGWLVELPVDPGYSAALCYCGPEAEVFLWRE